MGKGRRGQFMVEVEADALRVAIVEGLLDLTRPKGQSNAEAWADISAMNPGVAEMADRAATRAMIVIAEAASRGRMVQ